MLRTDKQKLILILKMLFYSVGFIRIRKNDTIVLKKHWYSFRKKVITVDSVFEDYIPSAMGIESNDEIVKFQMEMASLQDGFINQKLDLAFNTLTILVNDTEYKGHMLDWDFIPSFFERATDFIDDRRDVLTQIYEQIILKLELRYNRYQLKLSNAVYVKNLPATSIVSIQEILSRQREKVSYDQIAKISTGDNAFDTHMQKIYRVAFLNAGFT